MDYIDLKNKFGGIAQAARQIGIPRTTFRDRLKKQKQSVSLNRLGLKPDDSESAVLENMEISGTSRYYKLEDGGIWVKTDKEKQEQRQAIYDLAESLAKDLPVFSKRFR